MDDIKGLRIAYLSGYTLVGNGTLGTTEAVYFLDNTVSKVFTSPVPILPSDAAIGQTYVGDVFKHFARRRYRQIKLHVLSLIPNTSNSMVANIAPLRGGNIAPTVSNTTGAALSQAGVMGMKGHMQIASWQSAVWDLTPFIAGGSGAAQDEFNSAISAAAESSPSQASVSLASPCGFAVSGLGATAAIEAVAVHAVIVELVVDLLDFVASITPGGTVSDGKSQPFVGSNVRDVAVMVKHGVRIIPASVVDEKSPSNSNSTAVQAFSRSVPSDEGYVAIHYPSPLGGPPVRDPTRIESRKL
jgi:hypothetical protein